MPRYEFRSGKSQKFWEITRDGESFSTRWGRIGSESQEGTKDFDSTAQAKLAYQKVIDEKVKKGYRLVESEELSEPQTSSRLDLEKAIEADLSNPAAYLVYADWLQAQRDPRGELIVLQHAAATSPARRKALEARSKKLIRENEEQWLGSIVEANEMGGSVDFEWRFGFLRKVTLTDSDGDVDSVGAMEELLESPVSRFLEELQFGGINDDEGRSRYAAIIGLLAKKTPPCLRMLSLGSDDEWGSVTDARRLCSAFPALQRLSLTGPVKLAAIDLPELREFKLESSRLSSGVMALIATAKWPKLVRLEITSGTPGRVQDFQPIFEAKGLPDLLHLAVHHCGFSDELVPALASSRVLRQLETLDLHDGFMTAAGARAIKNSAGAFKHLKLLNLSFNNIDDEALIGLDSVCMQIDVTHQQDSDERYYSVEESALWSLWAKPKMYV